MTFESKRRDDRAIFAVLVVGVVVMLNLAAARLHGRLDLTEDHRFTLSPASRQLASSLSDPLTVEAYVSKDLPAELAAGGRYLRDLLDEFRIASGGKLRVELKDRNDQEVEERATRCGIGRTSFQTRRGTQLEVGQGYLGLCFWYDGRSRALDGTGAPADMEYRVAALIKRMTGKPAKVAFSTGHGERDLGESYSFVKLGIAQEHEVITLDPSAGAITDDVDLLIVAGPRRPFDERGRRAIGSFLAGGKGVIFLLDGMTPGPGAAEGRRAAGVPVDSGLDPLLEGYGFRVQRDLIFDRQDAPGPVQANGRTLIANRPAFVEVTPRDADSRPSEARASFSVGIPAMVFPFPSSVDLVGRLGRGPSAGETLWSLARSSPRSWRQTASVDGPPSTGPFALAYAYRRTGAETPARLVVFGDSDFATDERMQLVRSFPIYAGGAELLFRAVDWLLEDEALAPLRDNVYKVRPLRLDAEAHAGVVTWGNAVGVPLVFCIWGIWRWRSRRARAGQQRLEPHRRLG